MNYLNDANALVSKGFLNPNPSCEKGFGMEATTEGGGAPAAPPK